MNKTIGILTLVLFLNGCVANRHHFEPSNLIIEGKKRNGLIENRKPGYGDGHKDGCVIKGQISMDIEVLNDRRVSGTITDSKTNEPLLFATLKLVSYDSDTLTSFADGLGRFDIVFSDALTKIRTEYLGFRTLTIDLTKVK